MAYLLNYWKFNEIRKYTYKYLPFLNTNENLPAKKGIRSLQIASSF